MIQWRLIFAIVIRFSRLRFWVGYFIYFKIKHVFFQWMFFNLIKEINRLRKEINRLLSKGMSNIYLKVTIETFSKPRFYGFKECVIRSSFGELQLTLISLNFKTSTCNQKSDVWEQNCVWLFNILILKAVMTLKSKSWCILLNKNIKFNTNGKKSKMENPTHSFRGTNLVLQLVKESQIKGICLRFMFYLIV